jgi:hypothetical protein
MTRAAGIGFAAYLAWLLAGFVDFACHRRGGLAITSGWRECCLHFLQIGVIATGLGLWMLFQPSGLLYALLGILVAAHAVAGYADTAVASRRRPIRPIEQHVHSVLDMAPWVAVTWFVAATLDDARGWTLVLRDPALPPAAWTALLVPALLLVMLPALQELAGVLHWRRRLSPER